MKKLPLLIVVLFTVAAIIAPASALAGSSDKDKKKKEVVHEYPLISSVSADSITVTRGDTSKTYKITPQTQVEVRGQRATVADLQTGMMANVTMGMQTDVAGHITAGDAPAQHEKKDDKKKKK